MSYDTYNLDKIKIEGDFARTTFDAKLSIYPVLSFTLTGRIF